MLDSLLRRLDLDADRLPLVGVSACLLGRPVRYNGENRRETMVADLLARQVRFREFCPEVAIGLPVPRPPIQVVDTTDGRRVRGVADRTRDFTRALAAHAEEVPEDLDGFVLKARSPSCGLGSTPLMNEDDVEVGLTSGEFARALSQLFPLMPIVDESTLTDAGAVDAFVLRAQLYHAWRQQPDAARVRRWRTTLVASDCGGHLDGWLQRLEAAA